MIVLFFWIKDTDELNTFIKILNDLHEDINFTMEINNETLSFLDILICKEKCNITTDIYSKDTDTKQYLNFKSCHP